MTIIRLNPDGLHHTPGYHHVTVADARRTAYLAGQCPLDKAGDLVGGGDVFAQVDQVVANTRAVLASVHATPKDVVRTVIYVTDDADRSLGDVWRRLLDSPLAPAFTSASTLLGVSRLGFPGQLIELDVTAALPDHEG
ncbi:Enamine deaminase RidA, house cleaning of reactive enamine intermediates, YjgF/YER057c/UK114 family [Asanoa hainanensis]|uniref:Enamine deaminase RidA, house cleaning of reactive enamine intermediates, YjgF/YER057c/UK114 family n=1 Tax=Asanoa hainanensis TaxID=560556 RepID=A0A239MZG7_9ACTN|nr:RidA family protein [Asanoa hainanensis]SNT48101.1 Enamine deaminase RidA, house cleaning of reactive enamine intermediates, YjgF/YER057c/UK114 family [Asanoa hainanensis]